MAVTGRQAYLIWAVNRLAKLRAAAGPALTTAEIAAAGSVSPRAGWIRGAVLVVLAAVSLGLIILAAHLNGGLPPPTDRGFPPQRKLDGT